MDSQLEDEEELMNNSNGKIDKYFKWPREMDLLLLDLLKEEKAKGNKDEKKFNKTAWNTVIVSLNTEFEKIGKTINKTKAVNRLKTIQKQMYLAVELLDKKSGFGWNDITKKIEATPSVWERVIQVKPDYKLVHDKELYFLENARKLFKKNRATGNGAESAKKKVHRWQAEEDVSINDIDEMQMDFDQVKHFSNFNSPSPVFQSSPITQENASSASTQWKTSSKGIKRKRSDLIAQEIMEVTTSMKDIAIAITNSSKHIYSTFEIADELKKLGLDKWKTIEALEFLKDNEHLVERFFTCDDDIKLYWLKKKMEA